MLSAYKYRIYPNSGQEMRLKRSPLLLSNLYNKLRARKIEEYKEHRISLKQNDLRTIALEYRKRNIEFKSVYSQVAQNVADRVHAAFGNYFGRRARLNTQHS